MNFGISGRGVFDDVGDDPHGGRGRVDIGVADHELLEDVVLDGAAQSCPPDAAPCSSPATMIAGHHRQITAPFIVIDTVILVERNAVEQDLHILDTESIATPALPTSPTTRGWSLS